MEFIEIMKNRFSSEKFTGEIVDDAKIEKLLEMIKLSASSYGLQPYKVLVISNKKIKEQLLTASYNQEQITTCSHLLVFCTNNKVKERINMYEKMMLDNGAKEESAKGYTNIMRKTIEKADMDTLQNWAKAQSYIALGNALNGATALGLDSCPMEGFDSKKYIEILKLPEHLFPVVLAPIGISEDKGRDKLRYSDSELFEKIK